MPSRVFYYITLFIGIGSHYIDYDVEPEWEVYGKEGSDDDSDKGWDFCDEVPEPQKEVMPSGYYCLLI